MTVSLIILAAVVIPVLVLGYLAAMAPVGREDEEGWHSNAPGDDEDRE